MKVHDGIQFGKRDMENVAENVEMSKGEKRKQDGKHTGQEHQETHPPYVRTLRYADIVYRHDQSCGVIQDGYQDQHDGWHLPVFSDGDNEKKEQKVDRRRDSV